jgi:DNA-binding transcriptional regulator YiaG
MPTTPRSTRLPISAPITAIPTTITPREIEAIRHTLGLTKSALARQLHVTYQTIRRWEAGQSTPQPGHIHRLHTLTHPSVSNRRSQLPVCLSANQARIGPDARRSQK